jgi:hypothetical protein
MPRLYTGSLLLAPAVVARPRVVTAAVTPTPTTLSLPTPHHGRCSGLLFLLLPPPSTCPAHSSDCVLASPKSTAITSWLLCLLLMAGAPVAAVQWWWRCWWGEGADKGGHHRSLAADEDFTLPPLLPPLRFPDLPPLLPPPPQFVLMSKDAFVCYFLRLLTLQESNKQTANFVQITMYAWI